MWSSLARVRWIAFGTFDVRRHPRVGVLIDGLRDLGDEVTVLNVPLPLDTAGRVERFSKKFGGTYSFQKTAPAPAAKQPAAAAK